MKATETDLQQLEALYRGRSVFHGELHDHASTGGTSDGKCDLATWRADMEKLEMDFATILDHRQVRHMYLPEWEDGVFIGGTEPGTFISDSKAAVNEMHYNMLFEGPHQLEELLARFPEYAFTGGIEGHFIYPEFTTERFRELIDTVGDLGGFFVYPHPKQLMQSEDPCDYWFRDETGIEVFYNHYGSDFSKENYKLWTDLLAAGKRVWACAGCDYHRKASDGALTTFYAEGRSNRAYLDRLRRGDFVCGNVGIRMAVGDTAMGGQCGFEGKRVVFSVGDFHRSVRFADHQYRVELLNDQGTVLSQSIGCDETSTFAVDTEPCKFYRVEVWDATQGLRIAVGNPIWNV